MSARDELFEVLRTTMDDKDATEVADAYRAEVLREARKEILAAQLATPDLKARELWKAGYKAGLSIAAVITTP